MRLVWVLVGAVATVGMGLAGLGLVIARRVTAPVSERRYDLTIRGVDNSGERPVVILDRSPSTAAPGDYCLIVETGNWVQLAPEVEDRGPHLVGRRIVGQSREGLVVGERASWSGIYFETPADAGLQATDVGPGARLAHHACGRDVAHVGHPYPRTREHSGRNTPRRPGRLRCGAHFTRGDVPKRR